MANRVEYIKVARIDQDGNNLTNTLESLTQLTIPYSNGDDAVYPIENITRYNDYFLYQVGPASYPPNSNDSGSLLYDFSGSLGGDSVEIDLGGPQPIVPFLFQSGSGSSISFLYNDSENRIELETYPEKPIHIKTSNFYVTCSAEVFVDLYKSDSSYTFSSIVKLTDSPAIQSGSFKGPLTREVSISQSISAGDIIFLGATANSYPPGGGPYLKAGNLRGSDLVPMQIYITSSAESGPILETIPEPYLTSQFYGEDCDVLLNNADLYPENPFLQDLDYSTNPNVPVNFQLIISGTAVRGTVPESYYTSLAQTRIRYTGVKNQSSNVNIYDPLAGTSSFGDPINIGTFGQTPSVESLDTTIYEFEWGGGTTPEILGWGAVKMGKLLQVNSPNSVKTVNPSDGLKEILIPNSIQSSLYSLSNEWGRSASLSQSVSDYYYKLNSNNPVNHEISMYLYGSATPGSTPTLPSTTKILTTEYGVPTKSTFVVTSSGAGTFGSGYLTITASNGSSIYPFLNSGVPTTASYIRFFDNKTINLINSNYKVGMAFPPQSLLITGSYPVSGNLTASFTPLAEQLNNGERFFATFYLNLEEGFDSDNLIPLHYNTTPLGQKGVAEIVGIAQAPQGSGTPKDVYLLLKDNIDMNTVTAQQAPYVSSATTLSYRIGAGDLGCFIWKARAAGDNEFVMVQDLVTGVGAGAFTSKYTTQEITNNFENITKTYGSNKQ